MRDIRGKRASETIENDGHATERAILRDVVIGRGDRAGRDREKCCSQTDPKKNKPLLRRNNSTNFDRTFFGRQKEENLTLDKTTAENATGNTPLDDDDDRGACRKLLLRFKAGGGGGGRGAGGGGRGGGGVGAGRGKEIEII